MSIFDLNDFERQGKIENDVQFNSLEEEKQLLNQLTSSALRNIQIYTPDLEPAIYNDQQFIKNLLAMARGNRHARIQALVIDSSMAVQRGHAFLNLAQQLTSSIDIRRPSEEYQADNLAFILVDRKTFIYRQDINVFSGIYSPECRYRANKLQEIFTTSWEHAEPELQIRRLNI